MAAGERSVLWPALSAVAGLAALLFAMERPAAQPPRTDEFVLADISAREIAIGSDFSGIRLVVFGAVENSRQEAANAGYYDIVVVIRGPDEALVTRRKDRYAGLWINSEALSFKGVPSYYATLSTRPIDEIAEAPILSRYGIGFENLAFNVDITGEQPVYSYDKIMEFKTAVARIKEKERLYLNNSFGVGFLGPSLFRASVELPATVPVGEYRADVFLFRQGALLSSYQTQIDIDKAGIERYIYMTALNRPWLYGLASVLLAVAAGLVGWALFRRN